MDLVALASVICSFSLSVYTIYKDKQNAKDLEILRYKHESEVIAQKSRLEGESDLAKLQRDLFEEMIPLVVDFSEKDYTSRFRLLGLAMRLTAASTYDSYIWNAANSFVKALTVNYENRDTICWLDMLKSCANSINYHAKDAEDSESQPLPSSPQQKRSLFGRIGLGIRAGWKAFRESRL